MSTDQTTTDVVEVRECLLGLSAAIRQPEDSGLKIPDYVDLLNRALGLRRMIEDLRTDPDRVSRETLLQLRARLHVVFGAPGDWGYNRLGASLKRLYDVRI